MINDGPITHFLTDLSAALPAGRRGERVRDEVAAHLEDRAEHLVETGLEPIEAERRAVQRFGSVDLIMSQFTQQSPFTEEVPAMLRFLLTAAACLAVAYSAMHVVNSLFWDAADGATGWTLLKFAVAAFVITYCVELTRAFWRTNPPGMVEQLLVFLASLAMIAVGTASAVWCAHLGLVSGDWEYYGFVGGGLIAALGAIGAVSLKLGRDCCVPGEGCCTDTAHA